MNANFIKGFMKKASFKTELLDRLVRGLPVRMKNFSKKSLRKTKVGRGL